MNETSNSNYITVEELQREFRRIVGDQTCEIPTESFIAWLNVVLRRLPRAKGLDVLFRYQDTFELAPIRTDGAPATSWTLKGFKEGTIGTIIDIESMLILEADDCNITSKKLCFMPFKMFREKYPAPTDCLSAFTINDFGGSTKLIFNAPLQGHTVIDMVYTAFHPRVKSVKDLVRIPYAYQDILIEGLKIAQSEEAADFATARALWENWDYFVAETRELLHKQKSTLPLRQLRGSF